MSTSALILSMEKLLKLHKSLNELAVRKTDILKKGDIEALNQLIKEEQKHIAAIGQIEEERMVLARQIVPQLENPTVNDCLNLISGHEHESLKQLRDDLLQEVFNIQENNTLNQQLLHQSMQFIHFSMSLVAPQPQNYNYGPPSNKQKTPGTTSTGMFNSKA
ncbi:flagellar protein FlgN [Neobacillus sp. D3-1R]|uniref:flagellar protein FlgN n=1 Tax=Neobacillus sp. D3-1R TaxID=3445778 RepID=UPI003FA026FB